MRFNVDNFRTFPELFKFTTLITTIFLIFSIAAPRDQPPGTTFIWISAILAIIVDCFCIMVIGFDLTSHLFPQQSYLNWQLMECIFSSLFSINFFISIWLCVNSKSFSDSPMAYSLAATFCLANFVQHTLNVIYYVRIWMQKQRKSMHVIDPETVGNPSYGVAT